MPYGISQILKKRKEKLVGDLVYNYITYVPFLCFLER
jgi:hypothetical protein